MRLGYTESVIRVATVRFDLDLEESLGKRLIPEALVVQEDRNLIMGPPGVLDLDARDQLGSAYLAISRHRPLPLGRYLLLRSNARRPYWIYQAVVHDFEARPSCRPGDVRRALVAVLEDAVKRGFGSLAIQPLGLWRNAGLSLEEMVDAFDASILEMSAVLGRPLHLTLLLADLAQLEEISHLLRSRVLRKARRSFRTVSGDAAVVEVRNEHVRLHYRFVPGSLSGYMVVRVSHVA
jgi:hypothetical protein